MGDNHPEYYFPAQLRLSRAALLHNFYHYRRMFPDSEILSVVKANAYGHGLSLIASELYGVGVRWFGVAQLAEALQLRQCFDNARVVRPSVTVKNQLSQPAVAARILTWVYDSTQDLSGALEAELDLAVAQPQVLRAVAETAERLGRRARIHLKVETGMSRAGFTKEQFADTLSQLQVLCAQGVVEVIGLYSHFSCADGTDARSKLHSAKQLARFSDFQAALAQVGVHPQYRHLAATSGAIWYPQANFEMLRIGIGLYGLSPDASRVDSADLGLQPVAELSARLISVKRVAAGEMVSYGGTWTAPTDRFLGVVPLGYADGLPRQASGKVEVFLNGRRYPQVGRICMDQFMIDLGAASTTTPAKPGDEVILFGDPALGYPSADEWAFAADTINYTIVTQLAARIPRIVV